MTPNAMSRPTAAQLSNSSEGRGKPVVGRAVATILADPDVPNGGYVHAQPYLRRHLGDDEYEAFLDAAKAGDDVH